MSPTRANKNRIRYRYYVSQSLITGNSQSNGLAKGQRLSASQVETFVGEQVCLYLNDAAAIYAASETLKIQSNDRYQLVVTCKSLANEWGSMSLVKKREIILSLLQRIEVQNDHILLKLTPTKLATWIPQIFEEAHLQDITPVDLCVPMQLKRNGKGAEVIIESGGSTHKQRHDRSLIRLLAQAQKYRQMLLSAQGKSMGKLAKEAGSQKHTLVVLSVWAFWRLT